MPGFDRDTLRAAASHGSVRHRDVLARLLEITRRHCGTPPPVAQLPLCNDSDFEDRLDEWLAALGRNVAADAANETAPKRGPARLYEPPPPRATDGDFVAWIQFDTLEAIEPCRLERAADDLRGIMRARIGSLPGVGNSVLGRYGAGSFVWMRADPMTPGESVALAKAAHESLSEPGRIAGAQRQPRPSLGFTCFPQHGTSPGLLLTRACAAMRRARHYGIGYAFYDPMLDAAFGSPVGLASRLAHNAVRARRAGGTAQSAPA